VRAIEISRFPRKLLSLGILFRPMDLMRIAAVTQASEL
jgi:hypothetical protein